MSDNMNPQEVVEKLNKRFDEMKETNDRALEEIRKNGAVDQTTQDKLDRLEKSVAGLSSAQDEIAAKMNRPAVGGAEGEISDVEKRHADAFENWMRDPENLDVRSDLVTAEREVNAQKAVTIGTPGAGGYAVPEEISRRIHEKLLDVSPVRQVARVVQVSTSDYKELVDVLGDEYGWVGETDTRSETGTPSLAEVVPTMGEIYAYPKASEHSLDDMFFSVEDWLVRRATRSFAKGEGLAFISGNGTNKPTGFLNGTPVTAGDEDSPARAFGTLQYVASGNATGFGALSTTSPEHYPADVFLDAEYALKAGYRSNAVWMMNKSTLGLVRKFKDSEGNYIWSPGMIAGQPSTINGYNVVEAEDMPDVGANAFPVAFGDFEEGYLIADRVGMRITVDNNITQPGYVKFFMRKRVAGKLLNDDAIKVIKIAAS